MEQGLIPRGPSGGQFLDSSGTVPSMQTLRGQVPEPQTTQSSVSILQTIKSGYGVMTQNQGAPRSTHRHPDTYTGQDS
jgi:hypothetical protein